METTITESQIDYTAKISKNKGPNKLKVAFKAKETKPKVYRAMKKTERTG